MPTTPQRSLEPYYYIDPQAFNAEQQGVLACTWQYACHSSDVEKPGDYATFKIAGERLFCIRTQEGELKAFYNVCQHRAHGLLQGRGNVSQIVCPYHAWTYTLQGKLRGGPNLRSVSGLDTSTICLSSVCIEEFHGFVFANLDPHAAPMDEWYPGVREELLEYVPHIATLRPLEQVEVLEQCNWKVSVENYSECYHCELNHPTFVNGVVRPDTYDIQPQGYCLRHTTECRNLERMSYPVDLDANEHSGHYSSWFLWPTFSFQVYPGNILNTYQWTPVDHKQVLLTRGWFTGEGIDEAVVHTLAIQDRNTTVAEDITLIESVQRGLSSRGYIPGPLVLDPKCGVRSEHSIAVLQGWMREG